MAARDLAAVVLAGAGGYLLWRAIADGSLDMSGVAKPTGTGDGYYDKLARIESSNRPYVKARTSSASGLFQFTKATWESVGGQWGPDPTKAFGGLKPSIAEQLARVTELTLANIAALAAKGIAPTDGAKYAVHFLGPVALRVLAAADDAMVAPIVGAAAVRANPFLANMTVAGFKAWLKAKMGE